MKTYQFEYAPIDFSVKRLGLTHDPRVQASIKPRGTLNSFGRALVALRQSFIPTALRK